MGYRLGMNAKMYLGNALIDGTDEAAVEAVTWTEQSNVKDLTLNLETGESDITTRGNNGWRATAPTLKDGTVEFQLRWDPDDITGFEALRDAWLNSTEIAGLVLDTAKDTVGAQGLASNFTVTNFSRDESLEEAIMVDVSIKPSSDTSWYEQTGS